MFVLLLRRQAARCRAFVWQPTDSAKRSEQALDILSQVASRDGPGTVNIMDSRAIFRMDIGLYKGIIGPLLNSLHGIHVSLAYQKILTLAHMSYHSQDAGAVFGGLGFLFRPCIGP